MKLPLPKSADNVSHRITSGTQTAEYKSSEKAWYWTIAKLQGGREVSATVKVNVVEKTWPCNIVVLIITLELHCYYIGAILFSCISRVLRISAVHL